jgi:hypothetical protein
MNQIPENLRGPLPLFPLPWYSGGGLGWGSGFFQMSKDLFSHQGRIFQGIAIRESQHPNPHFVQSRGSLAVVFQLARIPVLTAIKLHDQIARRAVEVHDIAGDRMLPTKSVAAQALHTESPPQPRLRVGWQLPHRSGKPQSPSISVAWDLHRSNTVRPALHDQAPTLAFARSGAPTNSGSGLLPPPLVLGGRIEVGGGRKEAIFFQGPRRSTSPHPNPPPEYQGRGKDSNRRDFLVPGNWAHRSGVPTNPGIGLLPPPLLLGGRNEVGGGMEDVLVRSFAVGAALCDEPPPQPSPGVPGEGERLESPQFFGFREMGHTPA